MPTILDDIVAAKLAEVAAAKACVPEAELRDRIDSAPRRGFVRQLLRGDGVAVIAEVKKASPSAGVIRADFDPARIAATYERHGAACLSVLTDGPYFQGSLDDLQAARAAVSIPVLRKEFVLDSYQLVEARAAGADAVLLIAEILPGDELRRLHAEAGELGLDVLIELHDAEQLPRVLACGPRLVGVNNRDLRTFVTSLDRTLELLAGIPPGVAVVSESGIKTHADLQMLGDRGVRAVLVGESLMRADDIGAALDALLGRGAA
jgi:indole-3-glycerol phosphate synthase